MITSSANAKNMILALGADKFPQTKFPASLKYKPRPYIVYITIALICVFLDNILTVELYLQIFFFIV